MNRQRSIIVGGVIAALAAGCGDDTDSNSDTTDAGTDAGGVSGSGGKGGAGGKGEAGGGTSGKGGSGGQSASQDEEITIRFKAVIGGEDFACGKTYSGVGTKRSTVEPADFRLFVQDLALIDADDKEVPVKLAVRAPWQLENVALLDFEDGSGLCSGEGNSETNLTLTGTVPKGTYKGVTFSNGVPEEFNHDDPTNHDDPLKTYASLSWGWLLGFRFAVIQVNAHVEGGHADVDAGPGGHSAGPGGLLHVGSTGCSNSAASDGGVDWGAPPEIECLKQNRNKIKLSGYKVGESVIVADLAKLFEDTDLSVESMCHGSGDACPALFENFGVKLSDGKPLSSQSFFELD